jgi:putative hydrolase of the HAD superfamily
LKNIRHIIFDLGGVILNIDYMRTERAFIELGMTDFGQQFSQLRQSAFFDDWETGKINQEQFLAGLRRRVLLTPSDQALIDAWNAMLLDIPLRRLQILQQLQLHFDTFLLSNTNEIHEAAFNKILKSQCGFSSLGVFFDKVYFSHHIGLRKPGKEIFELILQQNSLSPEKTLFIDDSFQHIETARSLGLQTIWMEEGMTMEHDVFKPKISF